MTPQPISCTACPLPTASSQHRQTSQQQPAPTACTYQQHRRTPQPCRLPQQISTTHDRQTAQNQPTAARCRRGQILYLPGISTLQYSRKLG